MPATRPTPLHLAVFASGDGTNVQAILDAIAKGDLPAEVVLCVTNNPSAGVLHRAQRHNVPAAILDPNDFADEAAYVDELIATLEKYGVDFIALAGYMRKIPAAVVAAFRGRMLNIHPALLPAFGGKGLYGRRVHQAVLDYGAQWTGVTVHLVDEAYDTGPVVLQQPVPVQPGDTAETLAARVLAVEHRLYPEALRLFGEGRVSIEGRNVTIRES